MCVLHIPTHTRKNVYVPTNKGILKYARMHRRREKDKTENSKVNHANYI